MTYHIEKIIARVQPRLDILKYLSGKSWGADRATLLCLYNSWIRPVIEYCSTSYTAASPKLLCKLDQLQTQALRTITGSSNRSSSVALHAILRAPTLAARRLKTNAKLFSKLQRGDPRDSCVTSWLTRPRQHTNPSSRYNLNPFQPTPYHQTYTPYDILTQSASILDLTDQDTCPEPLLPSLPSISFIHSFK